MKNYLLLRNLNKGKGYIAVRCADGYRIITVTDALTYEAEERVLQPDCTAEEMNAMGLEYFFLSFKLIKGVAYDAAVGGVVVFHTRDKRYSYNMDDEYDEEWTEEFFKGVTRLSLPKHKQKMRNDWRKDMQDPAVVSRLKYISGAINIASVCSGLLCAFSSFYPRVFLATSAALWLAAVVLCVALPAYFSPLQNKFRAHYGYTTYTAELSISLLLLPLAMGLSFMGRFSILSYGLLIAITLSATALFILVMYRGCRDFREHFGTALLYLIFSAMVFLAATGYINHYANTDRDLQACTVTELRISEGSRGRDSFYCTVKTEQGKRVEVKINSDLYSSLDEGDTVQAYIGKGALGIEYAYIDGN